MARFYRKIVKKIAPELCKVLNSELQGRNDEKSALYMSWWGRIEQTLIAPIEDNEVALVL